MAFRSIAEQPVKRSETFGAPRVCSRAMSKVNEDDAARAAWSFALRNPSPGGAVGAADELSRRRVVLGNGVSAVVAIDEHATGERFARVSLRRDDDQPLDQDSAIPLAVGVYLAGRFEPFPVHC